MAAGKNDEEAKKRASQTEMPDFFVLFFRTTSRRFVKEPRRIRKLQ
jgi:hypothetical protein